MVVYWWLGTILYEQFRWKDARIMEYALALVFLSCCLGFFFSPFGMRRNYIYTLTQHAQFLAWIYKGDGLVRSRLMKILLPPSVHTIIQTLHLFLNHHRLQRHILTFKDNFVHVQARNIGYFTLGTLYKVRFRIIDY